MSKIVIDTITSLAQMGVDILCQQVLDKPESVICFATGKTQEPLYAELVERQHAIDFSRIQTFNLDEFLGLPAAHAGSFYQQMQLQLFSKLTNPPPHTNFLNGMAEDVDKECQRYEQLIKDAGGIDLLFLGIGTEGHIAFNEVGTAFESRTHQVVLTDETRQNNSFLFNDISEVPKTALTMGLATIFEAKKIALLAYGEHKAKAVAEAIQGAVCEQLPASILQHHDDVTFLLDEGAACFLSK